MPQTPHLHFHRCPHKRCDSIFACEKPGDCDHPRWQYKVCGACWKKVHRKETVEPQA